MAKITKEELGKIVSAEVSAAETWMDSDFAGQNADNLRYYYGKPFGDEKEGFSQVVTRDVMEAVEGVMPELMKLFTSGDNFVEFEPEGMEDEEGAKQATDYLNYIFQRRMEGFNLLYTWFKDALLMRNGIIKTGWEEYECLEIENFKGISEEELELLEMEDGVSVDEQEENEDGTLNVRITRSYMRGNPVATVIPFEEFRIKQRSTSIKASDFVAHVCEKSIGELVEAGYDIDDLKGATISRETVSSTVESARFSDPEEADVWNGVLNSGAANAKTEYVDAYVRVYDEDAKKVRLYNVILAGGNVLEHKVADRIPFINLSPIMMPHKFAGVCVADLVRDIQEIRSSLWRSTLDNLALANAGRYVVMDGQVNLEDLMDNQIGGIVREKVQGAVRQLSSPQIGAATLPMLQELDSEKEDRTGVSKLTQGLDPNALNSNTAATAVNQIMSAAQQKILLIARVFAETGVKELFWDLYAQVRQHQSQTDIVKLRGKYVEVNPFDWKDRSDMRVTVGLGNGNKDQQLYHLTTINNILQQVKGGPNGYLITAENEHNLVTEVINNSGYRNADSFISNPAYVQPPPPQPSIDMLRLQLEQQIATANAQLEQTKLQLQAQKDQLDAQQKAAETQLKMQEAQLEAAKFDWQKRVEAAELGIEATQKRPVGIGDGK